MFCLFGTSFGRFLTYPWWAVLRTYGAHASILVVTDTIQGCVLWNSLMLCRRQWRQACNWSDHTAYYLDCRPADWHGAAPRWNALFTRSFIFEILIFPVDEVEADTQKRFCVSAYCGVLEHAISAMSANRQTDRQLTSDNTQLSPKETVWQSQVADVRSSMCHVSRWYDCQPTMTNCSLLCTSTMRIQPSVTAHAHSLASQTYQYCIRPANSAMWRKLATAFDVGNATIRGLV